MKSRRVLHLMLLAVAPLIICAVAIPAHAKKTTERGGKKSTTPVLQKVTKKSKSNSIVKRGKTDSGKATVWQTRSEPASRDLTNVFIYNSRIKSYVDKLNGWPVADGVLAVHWPQKYNIVQLAEVQFVYTDKAAQAMTVLDVDLDTRWVFLKNPMKHQLKWSPESLNQRSFDFGYGSNEAFFNDVAKIVQIGAQLDRSPAAVASLSKALEKKIREWSQKVVVAHAKSKQKIAVGGLIHGPSVNGAACENKSVRLKSETFTAYIRGAGSIFCSLGKDIAIDEHSYFHFTQQSGRIELDSQFSFTDANRRELIQSILPENPETLMKDSEYISDSGRYICQVTQISPSMMDAYYCVRHSRNFEDIGFAVLTLGRQVGGSYHFTQLKMNGFSTEQILETAKYYGQAMGGQ